MPKKRVHNPRRKARSTTGLNDFQLAKSPRPESVLTSRCRRFIGVSLSGGKADKACVAVLEYYPEQKKTFLAQLTEKIKAEEFVSADLKIHQLISEYKDQIELVAFDVPLSLPKCLRCELKCPGYETCSEPEMKYIRSIYEQNDGKKKPKKMPTPYTQRCVDSFLAFSEPELEVHDALGANLAPLSARALFISRRLQIPVTEVLAKLAVWKLGQELKINKSRLLVHRNAIGGAESREIFLQHMSDQWKVFFYRQDIQEMIENFHAFDAFICAYTGFLQMTGKVLPRPKNFPKGETWVSIPE